ncbi:hypothetical protein QQ045_031434 [Rhodiola kirilowii]
MIGSLRCATKLGWTTPFMEETQMTIYGFVGGKGLRSKSRCDCDDAIREQLWEDLIAASDSINDPCEKEGGNNSDDGPMIAFNEFQLQADLSDGGFKGSSFTWSNNQSGSGRIWERLDRSILNGLATS